MNNDSFVAIFAALLLLNVFDVLILWSKENFKSFFRLKYALSLSKYRNSEASWSCDSVLVPFYPFLQAKFESNIDVIYVPVF